jgi:putative OPT family oligopeptide transporter
MAVKDDIAQRGPELSLRGLALGIAITLVFTAANVYLGLKVGLTVASSIPAAVISMALLSFFTGSNIRENNIVQTVASAAGALAAIIFVLPGLVIVGWWTGFPFWTSVLVCASGGILGVLFTIPLRRALVTTSDLPYPEGVAAAEVLKVGSGADEFAAAGKDAREGLRAIVLGSATSAGFAIFAATRIAASEIQGFFRLGATSATGYDFAFSFALLGVGHLVGLSVGVAMLTGVLIAWAAAVPLLTAMAPEPAVTLQAHVMQVWTSQVRFIGAGAIGVAALWTLGRLAHPLVSGFVRTIAASRARYDAKDGQTDRDLSLRTIIALTVACLALIAGLLWSFAGSGPLARYALILTAAAVPFVLIAGFLVAAICGYMAGLIGSSNSPVSGVGILAVVACSAMLLLVAPVNPESSSALVAFALFTTAIVFGVAVTSNDNLQDLKTGQLVGAAPWRQQIALIVGIAAGALVIPPILNVLAQAYGFAGAPGATAIAANPLPAPQANLIATLALGVIGRRLDWAMIGIGAGLGAVSVAADALLGARKWLRLPPLAVGLGIYLPMSATLAVTIGALIGWWYNRRVGTRPNGEQARHLGVLVASGLIVGETLFGVLLAGLIVLLNNEAPLAIVGAGFPAANVIALAGFAALVVLLYRWMIKRAEAAKTP